MLDCSDSKIEKVSVHHVGNKHNDGGLLLSDRELDISENSLKTLLLRFFLSPFSNTEFYQFTFPNKDLSLNPVHHFTTDVFADAANFHASSASIAQLLHELSVHPQIKSGDLFVASFSNVQLEGALLDAVGIFKSEHKHSFLKLHNSESDFSLSHEDGINIEKLDKGCLILNTGADTGYKVCIVDKSNKSGEAHFWKDSFLQLKPLSDEYHQTQGFMAIAKNYVTKQITEEFEVSKTDQIGFLNRSVEYFKTRETFIKDDFETEVFQDPQLIESFRRFDDSSRLNNDIEFSDSFDISAQAVKKQARVFKSVLKLDKNFHIYIHGDKQMIERGVDQDGRKYYKIYFQQET